MSATLDTIRQLIEQALERSLPQSTLAGNARLNAAIRDAVFPGGRRMRPLFTLLGASAAGVSLEHAAPAACAVEFLHSSSLIFDDLPSMDDARLRRGRPAIHARHGESLAVLAGLALFNEAWRLFGSSPALARAAASAIGVDGMIGGQGIDLLGPAFDPAARDRKTTSLMGLTFAAGALLGGAKAEHALLLSHCGERIGRAYQVLDDLMDDCAATGKTTGQDARHGRFSHSGQTGAREHAMAEIANCAGLLGKTFGDPARPLLAAIHDMFDSAVADAAAA